MVIEPFCSETGYRFCSLRSEIGYDFSRKPRGQISDNFQVQVFKNVQGGNEYYFKNDKTRRFTIMLTSLRQPGNGSQTEYNFHRQKVEAEV